MGQQFHVIYDSDFLMFTLHFTFKYLQLQANIGYIFLYYP